MKFFWILSSYFTVILFFINLFYLFFYSFILLRFSFPGLLFYFDFFILFSFFYFTLFFVLLLFFVSLLFFRFTFIFFIWLLFFRFTFIPSFFLSVFFTLLWIFCSFKISISIHSISANISFILNNLSTWKMFLSRRILFCNETLQQFNYTFLKIIFSQFFSGQFFWPARTTYMEKSQIRSFVLCGRRMSVNVFDL